MTSMNAPETVQEGSDVFDLKFWVFHLFLTDEFTFRNWKIENGGHFGTKHLKKF